MSVPVLPSTANTLDRVEERELVERAKHDAIAFGELYRRHRDAINRFALSRLRNRADAEDVTSEVFLRALRAIARYEERGIPFRSWLLRIAACAVVDHLRRQQPVEDIDQQRTLTAAATSLEDQVAGRDQVRRIGRAALQLPVRQREALALRLGHDLAVDEVARRMDRSPGAVKLLLHRAVRGVRAALPDEAAALELAS